MPTLIFRHRTPVETGLPNSDIERVVTLLPEACMNLPTHPPKGQRQSLDQLWLTKLEQEGRGELLRCIPKRPSALGIAVTQFNEGQYWQCHETLEEIWLPEEYPLRLFYHGLIKAAVGLLNLQRHNRRGAGKKLKDAKCTLSPFVPSMMGIDIAKLLADIKQRLELIDSDLVSIQDAIYPLPAVQIHDSG